MVDSAEIERRIQEREAKMRRLQEAEERERKIAAADRKESIRDTLRVSGIVVVSVLVLSGAVWGYTALQESLEDKSCEWHEHATFQMVIDGELQRWNHRYFDMQPSGALPPRAHMHQPDESQLHLEFGCADVKEVFSNMKVTLKKDSIKMDDILHNGETYREEGNKTLTYYLLHEVDGEWKWEDYTANILGHQLRNHQKLLILYGEYSDEEIAAYQAQVPDASGPPPSGHPSS